MSDAAAVAEQPELDEAATAADIAEAAELDAGFAGTPTEKTPPAEEDAEAKAAKEAADKVAADAAAAAAVPVEYVQITKSEWSDLQAQAKEITTIRDEHRKDLDRAFGKVGSVERTLKELQAATPAGHAVEITDDIVAELTESFPEIGGLVLKSFKNMAGKLKGTAAPAAAGLTPEQVDAAVTAKFVATQVEALEDDYPTWREIVGDKESKNPWRQWLATQPAEYQTRLTSTNSAAVISKSIAKFESDTAQAKAVTDAAKAVADKAAADKAAKDKDASTRQQRLEAAATSRGAGGHVADDSEDPFEVGFKSGPAGQKVS